MVNFTKSDSLFNYGMAPAIYSMAENKNIFGLDKGWRRAGRDVSYKKGYLHRENSRRMYYKLTFKFETLFEDDKIYIAHSFPYTSLKLNNFIIEKTSRHKDAVTRVSIGKTLSKRTIEGLIITYNLNKKKKDSRKAIFILARQHPGESQGSYVCEGVVERLLSKSKEAEFLLKNYIFYVIPMVNPDGVVFGHYRTNLSGKDLNRKWNAS